MHDFIKHTNLNVEVTVDYEETDKNILPIKFHTAYFNSMDFEQGQIANEIVSLIEKDKLPKPKEINDCVASPFHNFNIYHMLSKQYSWEASSYGNILSSLESLKNTLINDNITEINISMINEETMTHKLEKVRDLIKFIFNNTRIKVRLFKNLIIHPTPEQIKEILDEYHNTPNGGHCGYNRMLKRIQLKYMWQKIKKEIKKYVKSCSSCQANKIERRPIKLPMEITTTSDYAFERIAIDIVGPLNETESGNKFILSIQDDLTKFTRFIPIRSHTAEIVAKSLFNEFISFMGLPKSILSDQGKELTGKIMTELCKLFRIKQIQTTAYHPQTNGALERVHATLADYLKHYIDKNQNDWDEWLPHASFAYNTTPHTTTKFTPHTLVFGREPDLPSSLSNAPQFKYTYESYIDSLKYKLQKSGEIAKENIQNSKEKSKTNYDNKIKEFNFNLGDMVYLKREVLSSGQSKKLTSNYEGPYEIIKINSRTNVTIRVRNKPKVVHVNRLKPFIAG